MVRIYLARHGRTALNAAGVLRGRLDPPLDEVGQGQAAALAAAVARSGEGLVAVVASPLARARQTAAAVGAATGLPVSTDDRLADRDYGEWAGQVPEAVVARWGSLEAAPGVEPVAAVRSRARAALEELAARTGVGAAAVVAHDAVNRLLLTALAPSLGDPDALAQEPGCCNVVEKDEDGWTVIAVGAVPRHGGGLLGPIDRSGAGGGG